MEGLVGVQGLGGKVKKDVYISTWGSPMMAMCWERAGTSTWALRLGVD